MKDTIKNLIIGAFAIFGFITLISSSNNAPTVIHEGTPESHKYQIIATGDWMGAYKLNKETGEAWVTTMAGWFHKIEVKERKK